MAHGDVTYIDIPVSDTERATAFYGALFGWEIAEYPGYEGYPMWRAPNKDGDGGLAPREGDFTQPRSYVEVDSIEDNPHEGRGAGVARSSPAAPGSTRPAGGPSSVIPTATTSGSSKGVPAGSSARCR